jgi:hypothetical protein
MQRLAAAVLGPLHALLLHLVLHGWSAEWAAAAAAAPQVYYFKRGAVKLANRAYQNVRNDYIIHMDAGCARAPLLCCTMRQAQPAGTSSS